MQEAQLARDCLGLERMREEREAQEIERRLACQRMRREHAEELQAIDEAAAAYRVGRALDEAVSAGRASLSGAVCIGGGMETPAETRRRLHADAIREWGHL